MAAAADLPDNPLPACPETPNCIRMSQILDTDPDEVEAALRLVLREMRAVSIEDREDGPGLRAVFRVFFFLDDLDVTVGAHRSGSVVHVRSASRVGEWDLGVNARRVRRLFRLLLRNS